MDRGNSSRMIMRIATRPITNLEFAQAIRSVNPPGGWGERIAVALSGGSDSICLLFLLGRMLESVQAKEIFAPNPVPECLALTVDHGLQAASAATAAKTREHAVSQCVPHRLLSIPWGEGSFPSRPAPGEAFEELARKARNRLLLSAMVAEGANVIMFGHHADDQVETAVMRLSRGSGFLGLAGMRKLRRWGMGDRGSPAPELGWAGATGMGAWIVRPLLDVPKSRILATCEEHGLTYVDDVTNFQPSLTIRNAIRHALSKPSSLTSDEARGNSVSAMVLNSIQLAKIGLPESSSSHRDLLRKWVQTNRRLVEEVDARVTAFLLGNIRPAPPSTILLLVSDVPPEDIQLAVLLRILRFVSPNPWGSPSSEGGRRRQSLARIASYLWATKNPLSSSASPTPHSFTAGSQVLWTPVVVLPDGTIHRREHQNLPHGEFAWIATRQPPKRKRTPSATSSSTSLSPSIVVDITHVFAEARRTDVMFDCRFILRFRPPFPAVLTFPGRSSDLQLLVVPHGRYFLPQILLRGAEESDTILWELREDHVDPFGSMAATGAIGWLEVQQARVIDAL